MANPICLSPLKFYDALEKQERYKTYSYGHTSPVVMPLSILLPFQFSFTASTSRVMSAYIFDAQTDSALTENIASSLLEKGLSIKDRDVNGGKVLIYPGVFPLQEIKHEGLYYLSIKIDSVTYYSEVFCFTNALDNYLEIEYWNPESDFELKNGIVTFIDNFKFKILVNAELGKPEYNFEEESTSRLGYNFIESQVSKKVYKFNALLPEYLCDALRLIRICSNKTLICKGETYEMLSFEMDVDWQEQGDLASVNCEFEVDNVIVNLGGFRFEKIGGDFNNDFNNDYKK